MEEAWELAALAMNQSTPISFHPRADGAPTAKTANDGLVRIEIPEYSVLITDVSVSETHLTASLKDGRIISTPLEWYPRLKNAPQEFRDNWQISGFQQGVSWDDVNEDIHVHGMLAGTGGTRIELLSWEKRTPEGRYVLKDECIVE